jgi:lysophospholipase L1-like esterase
MQKAMLRRSTKGIGQPLIVSLHTWSGDYTQNDPLTLDVLLRDYNYIHPDFRGPNNRPEACGSPLAVSDIEDAVCFALKETGADPRQVHVVGVSGGGYATLLFYMQSRYPVRSFSAWAPVSDLEAWYYESLARRQKYSDDIWHSVSSVGSFNTDEARKRSPLYLPYPEKLRKDASLHIFTGVHDGYTGSVPITHSICMYNKVAREKYPAGTGSLVPEKDIIKMLSGRSFAGAPPATVGNREIHYRKQSGDVELIIFDGGHEQLVDAALALIPVNRPVRKEKPAILALGDSNGALPHGWVSQLSGVLPYARLINRSMHGKCAGISRKNLADRNSLLTIDTTLAKINETVDYIVIALGTNDSKPDYADRAGEYPANMRLLIQKIKSSALYVKNRPQVLILACPPNEDGDTARSGRLATFNRELEAIAAEEDAAFINIPALFACLPQGTKLTADGIHLTPQTARIAAEAIVNVIIKEKR